MNTKFVKRLRLLMGLFLGMIMLNSAYSMEDLTVSPEHLLTQNSSIRQSVVKLLDEKIGSETGSVRDVLTLKKEEAEKIKAYFDQNPKIMARLSTYKSSAQQSNFFLRLSGKQNNVKNKGLADIFLKAAVLTGDHTAQLCFVSNHTNKDKPSDPKRLALLDIFAECGNTDARYLAQALRTNSESFFEW